MRCAGGATLLSSCARVWISAPVTRHQCRRCKACSKTTTRSLPFYYAPPCVLTDKHRLQPNAINHNGDDGADRCHLPAISRTSTNEERHAHPAHQLAQRHLGQIDFFHAGVGAACGTPGMNRGLWSDEHKQATTGRVSARCAGCTSTAGRETAFGEKYPPALRHHNNNKAAVFEPLPLRRFVHPPEGDPGSTVRAERSFGPTHQNVAIYVAGTEPLLTFDNLGDVDMDPEIKNGDGNWFPYSR